MKMMGKVRCAIAIEFLNGCKREAEMGHSLSLDGDVDGEPLCLAMTSSLLSARRRLESEDESANWSPDADSADDNMPNRKHGLESEDETDKVGEAQERSEEEVRMRGWANF